VFKSRFCSYARTMVSMNRYSPMPQLTLSIVAYLRYFFRLATDSNKCHFYIAPVAFMEMKWHPNRVSTVGVPSWKHLSRLCSTTTEPTRRNKGRYSLSHSGSFDVQAALFWKFHGTYIQRCRPRTGIHVSNVQSIVLLENPHSKLSGLNAVVTRNA
jgi:hypothetical protein